MPAYDYIVIGAGSAGCLPAERLSQDPAVTVCLLEAGGSGTVTLATSSRTVAFGYVITTPHVPAPEQVYDFCIASICGIMRSLCGPDWNPSRVKLARSAPENRAPYQQYFRAPLDFDSEQSTVMFPTRWLQRPLARPDHAVHAELTHFALNLEANMPRPLAARLATVLYQSLAHTHSVAGIADMFGLHERTLHRRLQLEGTSFRQVLDTVRRNLAGYYLRGTSLAVTEIARALGYGSAVAFDHAFRRWFDRAPGEWRRSASRP